MTTIRYVRYKGSCDCVPFKPPLPCADPVSAYAPFCYETEHEARLACEADLARRLAEALAGTRCMEDVFLDHFVVRCTIHRDGRIEGGHLVLAFPGHGMAEDLSRTDWFVDMTREEIEEITQDVDEDGWTSP